MLVHQRFAHSWAPVQCAQEWKNVLCAALSSLPLTFLAEDYSSSSGSDDNAGYGAYADCDSVDDDLNDDGDGDDGDDVDVDYYGDVGQCCDVDSAGDD